MQLVEQNTPIEKHFLGRKLVYVKRDDLYGVMPAPQLGKLRGLRVLLNNLKMNGTTLVGCWDTRVSYLGQGVAAMCKEMKGIHAIISYPKLKNLEPPQSIRISESLDAEIFPIRGNHVSICYSQVKKYVEKRGGFMLPFGLECIESVKAIANEARTIPSKVIEGGTLVVCCGSGVTLAGILTGLKYKPKKAVGISSGRSVAKIIACLKKYDIKPSRDLIIVPSGMPYYEAPSITAPFPSHPNYDLKAWKYLTENLKKFPEPILFWNVGA